MEINKERLGPIEGIHEYLKKFGIKHTIIIRDDEVVLCADKIINENILWDGKSLSMEMRNGVILERISKTALRKYIKVSAHDLNSENARRQLQWSYPNQEIDFQAIEDALVDEEFVEKYLRMSNYTIRIEKEYYGKNN